MLRTLVTGGAGAIGGALVRRLYEDGHRIVVLDDLSSGYLDNLPTHVEFVEGSIADTACVASTLAGDGFDYVFHLAALFANQNSVEHPDADLQVNGFGTMNLAQTISTASWKSRLQRLVYASSSCVYGRKPGAIGESAEKDTETPYAVTKLMGEYYLSYYARNFALPVTTIRPFNSFGPGERPGRYRNVIPNFIRLALRGDPLTITGTGEETRDFTYVTDLVDCFVRAAVNPRARGQAYNAGTGRETSIRSLAETILRLTGSRSEIRYVPRRSWDHVDRRCANIDKAQTELGYRPETTVEFGLQQTVNWFRTLPADALA